MMAVSGDGAAAMFELTQHIKIITVYKKYVTVLYFVKFSFQTMKRWHHLWCLFGKFFPRRSSRFYLF